MYYYLVNYCETGVRFGSLVLDLLVFRSPSKSKSQQKYLDKAPLFILKESQPIIHILYLPL